MRKEFLILIAAVLMGVAAVVFNQIHRSGVEEELRSKISAETQVAQVTGRVSPGMAIAEGMLAPVNIPTIYVHPMAVAWTDRQRIIGQEVRVPLQPGQALLWSDMVDGSQQSVNDLILPGRGVITIPVDAIGSVAGIIQPGSRVDIMGIFGESPMFQPALVEEPPREAGAEGNSAAAIQAMMNRIESARAVQGDGFYLITVARNLTVFAVGSHTQLSGRRASPGYSSMSFDVSPRLQATILLAQEQASRSGGRLLCVLRSPETKSGDEELELLYKSGDLMRMIKSSQPASTDRQ